MLANPSIFTGRRARTTRALFVGALLSMFVWGTPAFADDDRVNELVSAGIEDFKAKSYLEAVSHFLEAKKIYDDPNLDWNVARGFEEAGDCANAIVWFQRVKSRKASGDDDKKKVRKLAKDAKGKIKKLSKKCPKTGTVAISCVEDDVRITIDGGTEFSCPLTMQLEPGDHTVVGVLGQETAKEVTTVNSGDTIVVALPSLAKREEVVANNNTENTDDKKDPDVIQNPVDDPPPVESEGWFARRGALFWTGLAGIVLGGGTFGMSFYFDGVTADAQDEYDRLAVQTDLDEASRKRALDLKDEGALNATLSNTFFYTGIGLLTVGTTLMVVDIVLDSGSESDTSASLLDGLAVTPTRDGAHASWTLSF